MQLQHAVRLAAQRWVALGVALACLTATAAHAAEPGALELPRAQGGWLLGDEWRFPNHNFVVRFAVDLAAIPAGVLTWERADWERFTGWTFAVFALMVGWPSPDVVLQDWVRDVFGPRGTRFTLWTQLGDVAIWALIWGITGGAFLYGWLAGKPPLLELVSLMLEAFLLGQVAELVPKLLIGREGPMNSDGRGRVYGPAMAFRLFPAGTPSGHASTLYAMMGVASAYWENPWLTAALHAFGAVFCATMLIDDYHYISDILWGAAAGWEAGTWVVRHRSTRYRNADDGVRVVPVVDMRTGAAAIAVGFRF